MVLIVDHKLRDESTDEANFVKCYIEDNFNFEARILTWNRDEDVTSNVQSRARDARYSLLKIECKQFGIENLCTAHNKNDQAETVLMNIMRGTGIDGLVGIRENSTLDGINIVRPMLEFSRNEIEDHLRLYNTTYVNDPSNESDKYERVKIRKFMKAISDSDLVNREFFISRLNLLSQNVRRSHEFIDHYVAKKIDEICEFFHLNVVTIDITQLMIEEQEVILRILRKILMIVGGKKYCVRYENLLKLNGKLTKEKDFCTTLGGCIIWNGCQHGKNLLIFSKEVINNQHKIAKNEIKTLQKAFCDRQSQYIVYNHDIYYKAQKMVENVPKAYKVLSCVDYEFIDGWEFFHSLGIARKY
jgi:tRNA(Ile)-lysidine synthase